MENEKNIGPDSPVEDRLELAINMTQTLLEMGVLDGRTEEFLINGLQRITGGKPYTVQAREIEGQQEVDIEPVESLLSCKKLQVKLEFKDVASGKSYFHRSEIEVEDPDDSVDLHDGVEILANELNDYMDGMCELTDIFKKA